jgi:hypothetical protein
MGDVVLDLSKTEEKKVEDIPGLEHFFPVASKKFNRPISNENQLFSQAAGMRKNGELIC